ncbi:hypothetical protein BJX70DRAFT_276217 [Aspergillus crustosus]
MLLVGIRGLLLLCTLFSIALLSVLCSSDSQYPSKVVFRCKGEYCRCCVDAPHVSRIQEADRDKGAICVPGPDISRFELIAH